MGNFISNFRHSVSAQRRAGTAVYHLLMLIVSFIMLYPVLWLVASSFKPNGDIFSTATSLIPQNFTLEHYIIGWKGFGGYSFTTFFKNSLFVAGLSAIRMTLSSALVAFGLARIRFKGRNFWFVLMVVTMMLPGQVMMIPRFVLFNKMGWVDNYVEVIINCEEEDIEIPREGEILFSRHYIDNTLLRNGILIRRQRS